MIACGQLGLGNLLVYKGFPDEETHWAFPGLLLACMHYAAGGSACLTPFFLLLTSDLSPGLVQRCVIIQKDQHGFGFTVSGDRIVLVQSVRPGECGSPPACSGQFSQGNRGCDSTA